MTLQEAVINSQPLPSIKKILVIRLSSFGDIILSFPLLKKLRDKFPGSEINFLTKNNYEDIISLNPIVNNVIFLKESLYQTRKIVKAEKYDLIIDIHKNFRSIFLSAFNGKIVKRYSKENFKKFLLVKFKINLFRKINPVFRKYLLSVDELLNEKDLNFTRTELNFETNRIIEDNYIVIAPSSKHFTKTYPADRFINFINELNGKRVVLVGDDSERDKQICGIIESKSKNVLNLCGKLKIKQLANVLFYSDHIICNDSAILHFSEALGKKVTAIFGSTVKEFGFFPQLNGSKVMEVINLECRPCTHIGRSECPLGHFRCMKEIHLSVNS